MKKMDTEEIGRCLDAASAKLPPAPKLAVPEADASAMLAEANAAYATLRRDPEGWAGEVAERETWDGTLADGLDEADRAAGPEADPGPQGRRYFL